MIDVLMVEDTDSLSRLYDAYLQDSDYQTRLARSLSAARKDIELKIPDLILLDIKLPDGSGMDLLQELSASGSEIQTVVMTANGSSDMAVEAIRLGAFDFLTKPFDASRLLVTLDNATKHLTLNKKVATYASLDRKNYCGFVGQSMGMQAVYRIIETMAKSKATGFILGESGTGKELVAEAIHQQSDRADGPFHVINCGAIPAELMESELFGHVKGSFSGATSDREGAASAAAGGTLFLDEICEMDLDLQSKLLRFIQTGAIRKVGSDKIEKVDVRFVCATNRDPLEEVSAGRFREDLYYRLHVIPIELPPLREREKDVLLIADHFLKQFAKKEGSTFKKLSKDVRKAFLEHSWPGNVRELENLLHRTTILNQGDEISLEMLPTGFTAESIGGSRAGQKADQKTEGQSGNSGAVNRSGMPEKDRRVSEDSSDADPFFVLPRRESDIPSLAKAEEIFIRHVVGLCDDNVHRAAGFLHVAPSTIYRKMRVWDESKKQVTEDETACMD